MNLFEDFPFESKYADISGCSMHYIDEGRPTAPAILFLHGVPSWSYTFRKVIPHCVKSGFRVIAPDMIGFGLSDKPPELHAYSLNRLLQRTEEFITRVGPEPLVLFAHDWGAVIGMLLASRNEKLFSGLIFCNGLLPLPGMKIPWLFRIWKMMARFSPVLPVGSIVNFGSNRNLSKGERKGYSYPFNSNAEKRAIRRMPQQLPMGKKHPEIEVARIAWLALEKWNNPVLTVFGDDDRITRGGEKIIQRMIPGSKNQDHLLLDGGHFLQEDAPHKISDAIIKFMEQFG